MSNANPVYEFLGLRKQAGFFKALGRGLTGSSIGHYMAPAIASAGIAAAGLGIKGGYGIIREKLTRQRDYKAMLEANPTLRGSDARQVNMIYNSLRRLSPTMAADPLVAGSFVRKHVELAPESGVAIDFATAKAVAETQKNIAQAKSSKTSVYEAMLGGMGKGMTGIPKPGMP